MSDNIYVITYSVNDYDQHGDYLMAVFRTKPSIENIKKLCNCDDKTAKHIHEGGGRQDAENIWHHLVKIRPGEIYEERGYGK